MAKRKSYVARDVTLTVAGRTMSGRGMLLVEQVSELARDHKRRVRAAQSKVTRDATRKRQRKARRKQRRAG